MYCSQRVSQASAPWNYTASHALGLIPPAAAAHSIAVRLPHQDRHSEKALYAQQTGDTESRPRDSGKALTCLGEREESVFS